jgi:hypothetical protein
MNSKLHSRAAFEASSYRFTIAGAQVTALTSDWQASRAGNAGILADCSILSALEMPRSLAEAVVVR